MSPRLLKYYNHIFRKKSSISPRYGYKLYQPHEKKVTPFPPLWTRLFWTINMKVLRFHGKRLLKFKYPRLFFPIRMNFFSWIANLYIFLPQRKPLSLMISAHGSFFYTPLFEKTKIYDLVKFGFSQSFNGNFGPIKLGGFLVSAPNVSALSCVAFGKNKNAQYILSRSSRGFLVAKDFLHFTCLISLPSSKRKLLSFWDVGIFSGLKKFKPARFYDCKVGFKRAVGFKVRVRGVAKNSIDHPHGGRTKAIAHPRSPWGWSTKVR